MKSLFGFALALVLFASNANAHEYKLGSLEIGHPWARATPKGATIAGGYLSIKNTGSATDRLVGGSVEVANRVEVHEMRMDQGVMQMREIKAIEIKPGETVEFTPGSYHLMFVDLKHPLQKGDRVRGTLNFEKAGSIDVEFVVEGLGAQSPNAGDHGGHGMGQGH
jgi:copper(I)-binding protein